MGVFDDEIAQAKEMIQENGQLCDWYKSGVTVPAPTTQPWITTDVPPNPASYKVYIVFVSAKLPAIALLKGTSVPEGEEAGLMAQVIGFTPEISDKVVRGSKTYVIKDFDVVAPNGEIILYKLEFE